VFATAEDSQTFVAVEIYQGEHEHVSKNRRLGKFILGDLRPNVRGATRVEVAFTMDADGILQVSATEVGTGRETTVQIEPQGGLTTDEIDRLSGELLAL